MNVDPFVIWAAILVAAVLIIAVIWWSCEVGDLIVADMIVAMHNIPRPPQLTPTEMERALRSASQLANDRYNTQYDSNWLRDGKEFVGFVTPAEHQAAVDQYRAYQRGMTAAPAGIPVPAGRYRPGSHSSIAAEKLPEPVKSVAEIRSEIAANYDVEAVRHRLFDLQIRACSDSQMWYAKYVGTETRFPYLRYIESEGLYLSREPTGFTNVIKSQDAVLVNKVQS